MLGTSCHSMTPWFSCLFLNLQMLPCFTIHKLLSVLRIRVLLESGILQEHQVAFGIGLWNCCNQLQVADEVADTSCACQTCGKHFNTANAYENHLKSKKHREAVAKQDKCLMPDVQQMNAKNDGRTKDSTYSGNQQQCDSEVKSMAGAVGGVTEHLQQDRDIGNCLLPADYYLSYIYLCHK